MPVIRAATRKDSTIRGEDHGASITLILDESDPADRSLLHRALAFQDAIVASDAMPLVWADGRRDSLDWPPGGATHPRTAGTFSKSLGLMVRESGAWSWAEAFRRCAYLPARVLDGIAPAARGKGWLGAGSAADIVVIDPSAVSDAAIYSASTRPSVGVRHLLVNGEFVVRDGSLLTDAFPGRPVRGEPH